MKVLITQYPFFREDFEPIPCDEEKAAYVGLTLEATEFVTSEASGREDMFPLGMYMVPVHLLLLEVMKFDEVIKLAAMPRWLPFADLLKETAPAGGIIFIPIPADCCQEIRFVN